MDASTPDLKDAIVAILGASVSLGGLLLVFSGSLFALGHKGDSMSNARIERYRSAGRNGLYPFTGSLMIAAASLSYWVEPCKNLAYALMIAFVALILATIFYGFWAARLL